MTYHRPVLLNESIQGLKVQAGGIYADLTFGGGGHSRKILKSLGKRGRLLAFDQDEEARENVPEDERITFIHANFRFIKNFLDYLEIEWLDGILVDLGVSSHQLDENERGFAFRSNTSLDMRMNNSSVLTAESILNEYAEDELIRVFREYGELKGAHRYARKIINARSQKRIENTRGLIEIMSDLIPLHQRNKMLARLFQALRIEVNDEMGALRDLLRITPGILKKEGRLVVLSYHSIEDRMVKNMIKTGNVEGILEKDFYGNPQKVFKAVNKNVITAGEDELRQNPRARSAKLRVAEKV